MSVPLNYALVLLVWSTTPLTIVWSSQSFEPMAAGGLRLSLALLVVLVVRLIVPVPPLRFAQNWRAYVASAMGLFPALALVYFAAAYLPSGLISVLFGMAPFFVMALEYALFRRKAASAGQVLAVLLAFVGLVVLVRAEESAGHFSYLGLGLILTAVTFYALSTILVKQVALELNVYNLLTGSLLVATPLYVLVWLLSGGQLPEAPTARSLWAIAYLGVVGSVLAYMAYFSLLKSLSATVVSLIPMITPAAALVLGIQLNGEQLSSRMLVGIALILAGIWLYQWLGSRHVKTPPVASE